MQRSGVLQRAKCFFMPERGDSSGRGYYFVPVEKSVFSFSTCKLGCVPQAQQGISGYDLGVR
jgi:hypothetical protein